uniref:Uncharacterized protein n=1 Tax=Aegilops tauschii TaxID=37682 RepID=M8BWE8_AEGTA
MELYIDIQEMVRDTRERPEADFSKLDTKIQRFPQGLRPGVEERYIIPSFVSLGPYHHGSPHLRETEELKHAAAHYFCEMSGHSVAHVYDKILHIAGEGRSCYVHDAVAKFTDAEFALAEIGIKLTASSKTGLADMSVQRGYLFGQLSLTPLFVNDVTACWLISMAAYEACVSTTYPSDGFVISSYISFMAMLMDKEEDVHELRAKHIVGSFFSNTQRLVFFKGLATHLRLGRLYFIITDKIDKFKRERPEGRRGQEAFTSASPVAGARQEIRVRLCAPPPSCDLRIGDCSRCGLLYKPLQPQVAETDRFLPLIRLLIELSSVANINFGRSVASNQQVAVFRCRSTSTYRIKSRGLSAESLQLHGIWIKVEIVKL